jgi:catalase
VHNFVENIGQATAEVQRRMVWHLFMVEDELGQRVGDGLGISADDIRDLPPLPTQQLSEAEQDRLENLGKNGPRDVSGKKMTHCVPNKHVPSRPHSGHLTAGPTLSLPDILVRNP